LSKFCIQNIILVTELMLMAKADKVKKAIGDAMEKGELSGNLSATVPAVDRAARILFFLMEATIVKPAAGRRNAISGRTLTEIYQALGINKSTAHSILNALREFNLVEKNEETGRWTIGFKAFELGMAYHRSNPIFGRFDEVANQIRSVCNESVYYGVRRGIRVLYVNVVHERSHALTVGMMPGDLVPAHSSALGKALLSGMADADIRELYQDEEFERRTERTLADVDSLIREVARVRDEGYAFQNEENESGVCAIAAPIVDPDGKVVASIGVGVPSTRMNLEKRAELAALLMRGAEELSGDAGLTRMSMV
jgi:DNA-binding IclR family transcriptional regulator